MLQCLYLRKVIMEGVFSTTQAIIMHLCYQKFNYLLLPTLLLLFIEFLHRNKFDLKKDFFSCDWLWNLVAFSVESNIKLNSKFLFYTKVDFITKRYVCQNTIGECLHGSTAAPSHVRRSEIRLQTWTHFIRQFLSLLAERVWKKTIKRLTLGLIR